MEFCDASGNPIMRSKKLTDSATTDPNHRTDGIGPNGIERRPTLSRETISAEIGTQTECCTPTSVPSPYAKDAAVEQRSTKRPGWMADVYRRLVEEGGAAAPEPASPIGANLR